MLYHSEHIGRVFHLYVCEYVLAGAKDVRKLYHTEGIYMEVCVYECAFLMHQVKHKSCHSTCMRILSLYVKCSETACVLRVH